MPALVRVPLVILLTPAVPVVFPVVHKRGHSLLHETTPYLPETLELGHLVVAAVRQPGRRFNP